MRYLFNPITILIVFICIIPACSSIEEKESKWEIAFKNDEDGNTLLGSKQKLINSIRQESPIRIAWGAKGDAHSIEHISEPIWIAILDEKEVIAHLEPQVLSVIDWDNLLATYSDANKLNQEWRVVITTKDDFDAIWYDKKENRQIKRVPQNHVLSWFVQTSKTVRTKPFFEK